MLTVLPSRVYAYILILRVRCSQRATDLVYYLVSNTRIRDMSPDDWWCRLRASPKFSFLPLLREWLDVFFRFPPSDILRVSFCALTCFRSFFHQKIVVCDSRGSGFMLLCVCMVILRWIDDNNGKIRERFTLTFETGWLLYAEQSARILVIVDVLLIKIFYSTYVPNELLQRTIYILPVQWE